MHLQTCKTKIMFESGKYLKRLTKKTHRLCNLRMIIRVNGIKQIGLSEAIFNLVFKIA